MPTNNATWREESFVTWGPGKLNWSYYQNFINGDTIFLGKTYHKIYKTGYDYNNVNYVSTHYTNMYVGAIWEDSSKHVYVYTNKEVLLYDFNLQIGDTLPNINIDTIPAMYGSALTSYGKYFVDSIDSVLVSGVYHKRFKIVYSNGNNHLFLIEGMGASTGLISYFFGSAGGGYSSYLQCFKQNGVDAYPDGSPCSLVGLAKISLEKHIKFYPNPSNGLVNFDVSSNEVSRVQALNLVGEIVSETKITETTGTINLSTLSKGVYYLKVVLNNQSPIFEKIIIN